MAYEMGLSDVSDEQLNKAANHALRAGGSFMPTPGQLRQLALTGGVSYQARAEAAFHELDKAVLRYGADYSVSFDDGLINAAVKLLGGWQHVCTRSDADFEVWLRKSFVTTYCQLCESPNIDKQLLQPLIGNYERANAHLPPDELAALAKRGIYVGTIQQIPTKQPVMFPPTKRPLLTSVNATMQELREPMKRLEVKR